MATVKDVRSHRGAQVHLLVVGGGRGEMPDLAREASEDLRLTLFCRAESLSKQKAVDWAERVFVFKNHAPDAEWVAAAAAVHARDPFDSVATFSEKDQDKCAAVGAELGLSTHTRATVEAVHDKLLMRRVLRQAGVDPTVACEVTAATDAAASLAETGLPAILKPVQGMGSRGIVKVASSWELERALQDGLKATDDLDDERVMVETFHFGDEHSVECLSERGQHVVVCVVDKRVDPLTSVEVGHTLPSSLEPAIQDEVGALVRAALDALGVRDGVTHTEVMRTPNGDLRIIETHLRLAGDEIPYLVREAVGVDLLRALAQQAVGQTVLPEVVEALKHAEPQFASIGYMTAAAPGTLISIGGLDEARAVEGVKQVEILAVAGAALEPTRNSEQRLAFAWAVGNTRADADEAVTGALGCLTLTMAMSGVAGSG